MKIMQHNFHSTKMTIIRDTLSVAFLFSFLDKFIVSRKIRDRSLVYAGMHSVLNFGVCILSLNALYHSFPSFRTNPSEYSHKLVNGFHLYHLLLYWKTNTLEDYLHHIGMCSLLFYSFYTPTKL